jgi:hypothetical protein
MLFRIVISFGSLIKRIPAFFEEIKLSKLEFFKIKISEFIEFNIHPSFSQDIFLDFI